MINIRTILFATSFLTVLSAAHAEGTVLIGGYFPAQHSDINEYFVHITAVDGISTKNVNYKTRSQIEQIEPGEHVIDITCGYKFSGSNYASTPRIKKSFQKGVSYQLIGVIHTPTERKTSKSYCDVTIIESNG